jgi:L-iditol 2-dehydrogenase
MTADVDASPATAHTVPDTMRAAVLFGPGDIRVVDRPVPQPGPHQVLVQVAMCGTCGTDLKIFDGHFPQTPPFGEFTPGHEWAGTVVALGESVDEFAVAAAASTPKRRGTSVTSAATTKAASGNKARPYRVL